MVSLHEHAAVGRTRLPCICRDNELTLPAPPQNLRWATIEQETATMFLGQYDAAWYCLDEGNAVGAVAGGVWWKETGGVL